MPKDDRERLVSAITEAVKAGARKEHACNILGLNIRTLQRWEKSSIGDRRSLIKKKPANKLSKTERSRILAICCSDEYKDLTPNEIVPLLAAKGTYIA